LLKEHETKSSSLFLFKKGTDATEVFEDIGHSEDAYAMLKDYLIGTLKQ